MLKRHAIQVLRAAGHSQDEIARLTDVSIRSVRRVEGEPAVAHVDNGGERDRRRIGRPSTAEPFRSLVVGLLAQDPALLSVEVFRRAKLAGYPGGKSALYDLIHAIRPNRPRPVVRFEVSLANFRSTTSAKSMCGFWMGRRSTSISSPRG